jgi:glycosyltransferase involved in cell wall biosynthesis
MRVLVVQAPSRIDKAAIGHTGRRLPELFRKLSAGGVEIHVALMGDPTGRREAIAASVASVRVLPALPPAASALAALPAAAPRIRSLVRRLRPDLVEGVEPMPAIAAGLATRGGSRPVVTYHRHHETGRRRLVAASRVAAHLTDRTLVSTPARRARAARADRVSADRVLVTRMGTGEVREVGPDELSRARRDLGIAEQAPVVGVVSRLRAEKGIDVFLAALDRVQTEGVHAVVVGSGPEERALRDAARGVRTPVHFLGHRNDVGLWLRVADVIAIPSRRDAFPRAAAEAMAAARPLVASRVGGLVDAVDHDVSGLLVPPEDPDALGAALDRLLGDLPAAEVMGRAARSLYERHYTLDAVAAAWRSAWETALGRPHPSA